MPGGVTPDKAGEVIHQDFTIRLPDDPPVSFAVGDLGRFPRDFGGAGESNPDFGRKCVTFALPWGG